MLNRHVACSPFLGSSGGGSDEVWGLSPENENQRSERQVCAALKIEAYSLTERMHKL